jgi:thymidylate kinase
MTAPELIDAAVAGRVLVYGSLPPGGRDLDLLVRPPERDAAGACLASGGFVRRGDRWARFAGCSAEVVELTDAASWRLPAAELQELFGEGLAIDGLAKVVRPSPHHDLLILARRLVAGAGELDLKRRARLKRALDQDPGAWERARERADSWRADVALQALEQTWRSGAAIAPARRAQARRELGDAGRRGARARLARLLEPVRRLPRPGQTRVVALSGLDGAGKSSQAIALSKTLERLGHEAVVVRTRITWDDLLWTIARPLKRLLMPALRLVAARGPRRAANVRPAAIEREPASAPDVPRTPRTEDPVTLVREGSAILTGLWTLLITLANAVSQWRSMRRALLGGAVVICDRYTLDSIVELRYSYGSQRPLRAARAALAALYPTPARAYFLDVQPQTALARKGEWGLQWLSEHRDLYLQECPRIGVCPIDGERPRDEICAEIARDVWLSGI